MKIFIVGATGRVGSRIVNYALKGGHEVVALVRQPDKLAAVDGKLTLFQGDARNEADIRLAMQGADVAVSALGTDGTTTLSESISIMIDEMSRQGIQRIVTVGTAGILQSRTNPELLRYQSAESKRRSTFAAEEHQRVYELLKNSDLDWTIVCPTFLPDGEPVGEYRVERDYLPEGGTSISVGDTAEFTYRQINSGAYSCTRVGIAY
ncbi:putative NADH-flavin reductase [Paenibacillus cellulosilyticus]|uniref:Putative NADH-flavin reductase n=1 Tax=Paenibacillus cellulosilyticus TaxID=375489 RepID=A0A2V2YV52_9BACL|nr:SDR family oxidoreductase [Paenibacillus cellulosilyticus]PWW02912.1 putative NADH-flavin reductase [Paenibacillus cellulosilyticus]QKS45821.1 SDR family oxidoreductase [Paenibacillus cellulosilyticus]